MKAQKQVAKIFAKHYEVAHTLYGELKPQNKAKKELLKSSLSINKQK